MSRIGGLNGQFHGDLLATMMKSMKNGKSNSGIFLSSQDNTIYNRKFCMAKFGNPLYTIGLGTNFNQDIDSTQPIKYKNLVFIMDGTIYNIDECHDFLNGTDNHLNGRKNHFNGRDNHLNGTDILLNNDINVSKLIFDIINSFYKENNDLLDSIIKTIKIIDGDYTFAVYDGENLAIARDSIGIRPLYYFLDIDNTYNCFASLKKAFWKIGIENSKIKTLKPGYVLYNWEEIKVSETPLSRATPLNSIESSIIKEDNYDNIKNHLKYLIEKAVLKRILNVKNIGLLFSGGVDSSILLFIIKNFIENKENLNSFNESLNSFKENLNDLNVSLYSVGNKGSKDLKYSKKIAKELDIPIKTKIIDENIVKNNLKLILEIIEENNLIKVGVGMTLHLAIKLAIEDNVKVVLSGLGADELFGGYHRYLDTLKNGGNSTLYKEFEHDIRECYHVNLERDNKIANFNGMELRIPYLDKNLIDFSMKIPVKYKINSQQDNLRKNILRDIAIDLGVCEEVAMRSKKAAQYGSGIDKILRKKVLKELDIDNIMEIIINNYYKKN